MNGTTKKHEKNNLNTCRALQGPAPKHVLGIMLGVEQMVNFIRVLLRHDAYERVSHRTSSLAAPEFALLFVSFIDIAATETPRPNAVSSEQRP